MARVPSFLVLSVVFAVFTSIGNAKQSPAEDSVAPAAQEQQARNSKHSPETIVAPAGTRITADISEENPPRNVTRAHPGKVANIVQVGSTVAIPALSKVTIQDSVGLMELTDVTVNGVRYELQTDRVAIQEGSMSEATFTLKKDLTVRR